MILIVTTVMENDKIISTCVSHSQFKWLFPIPSSCIYVLLLLLHSFAIWYPLWPKARVLRSSWWVLLHSVNIQLSKQTQLSRNTNHNRFFSLPRKSGTWFVVIICHNFLHMNRFIAACTAKKLHHQPGALDARQEDRDCAESIWVTHVRDYMEEIL